jgi:hypothetical protein
VGSFAKASAERRLVGTDQLRFRAVWCMKKASSFELHVVRATARHESPGIPRGGASNSVRASASGK